MTINLQCSENLDYWLINIKIIRETDRNFWKKMMKRFAAEMKKRTQLFLIYLSVRSILGWSQRLQIA